MTHPRRSERDSRQAIQTRKQVTLTSHPQPSERDSRQAIQTGPDHSNRVVPSPRSIPGYMLPVAPAPGGSVCHQVQQQTATVCIADPRPPGMGKWMHSACPGRTWTHMPSHQQSSWWRSCRTTHATQ